MKKSFILLVIILAGIFIIGCPMDSITYCPYCSYSNISKVEDNVYKCNRESCGKTFGAVKITAEE
jgi:uncharacterized alpha/beta hydrolase family protein